jgi:beta-glucosidase
MNRQFLDPPAPLADPHPDPSRTALLRRHLEAAQRAIEAGVDLRGYFVRSLMDNLE